MAIEHLSPPIRVWPVSIWVPNEYEDQILGGTQTHSMAGLQLTFALQSHAMREGLDWLVRLETQILYQRATGAKGSFYPDVIVAFGVTVDPMKPYDTTLIGKPPELVMEIISAKTSRKDRTSKLQAYAEMGVDEYVTFDPRPRKGMELKGYRLVGRGQFATLPEATEGGLWLNTVNLRVAPEKGAHQGLGNRLRVYTRAGERLPYTEELDSARVAAEDARLAAEEEARRERAARRQAEDATHAAEARAEEAERRLAELPARMQGGPSA